MRISVVMATYNGESFLEEQLESLVDQTRMPDELVVCDDGSTDDTLEILQQFEKAAPFAVRVHQNESRLGYSKNFGRAIKLSEGEIIFPSDQDDVWFPSKIERISSEFLSDGRPLVVINDCELTDGQLNPSGLSKADQIRAAGLGLDNFVSGCCSALHSSMKELVIPIPAEHFPYDVWMNRLALVLERRQFIPEILQWYRRHGDNASGWFVSSTDPIGWIEPLKNASRGDARKASRQRVQRANLLLERLQAVGGKVVESSELKSALDRVEEMKHVSQRRLDLQNSSGLRRVVSATSFWLDGGYEHFSDWKSMVKDIIN